MGLLWGLGETAGQFREPGSQTPLFLKGSLPKRPPSLPPGTTGTAQEQQVGIGVCVRVPAGEGPCVGVPTGEGKDEAAGLSDSSPSSMMLVIILRS